MRKIFAYIVGIVLVLVGFAGATAQEVYTAEKIVSELDGSMLIRHVYDPEGLLGKKAQGHIEVVSNAIYAEKKVCLHTVVLPTLPSDAVGAPKDFLRSITTRLKSYADEEGRRRVVFLFVADAGGKWAFLIDEQPRVRGLFSVGVERKIVSTISADMEARAYGAAGIKAIDAVGTLFGMKDIEDDRSMEIILPAFYLIAIALLFYFGLQEYKLLKKGSIGRYNSRRKQDRIALIAFFVLCLPVLPLLPIYLLVMILLHRKYPIKYPCHNCGSMKGYRFISMKNMGTTRESPGRVSFYYGVTKFTLSCKRCGYILIEKEVEKLSGDHATTVTREMMPAQSTEEIQTTIK